MSADIEIRVSSERTGGYPLNEPTKVFTAFIDGQDAGRLYFVWNHETQDQPVVHVSRVDVRPRFRRRGVSTALHRAAAAWLRARGDFRLGSGDVITRANVAFWEKLEAAGLAKAVPSGFMTTEWEMMPGALIPNGIEDVTRNPLLAKPPHRVHQLRDTRWFRRMVGRQPRESDYEGVHTATDPLIAAAYAMGSCDADYDEANGYPVLVTLDVSGLEALPDVDALVRGGEAADVARSEYRTLVDDGKTMNDILNEDEEFGAEPVAREGDEPAAFIFEDVGSRPLHAIRDHAEASGEDEDEIFERFLATGELPNGALTRLVGQQRYLNDFDLDRVVRVEAVRPWWRHVIGSYEDAEFEKLQERGYQVFTSDELPIQDPGDRRTLYEAPDARERTDVEYHGTTSAVIDLAFPGLIPADAPFPVEPPDEDE